MSLTAFAQTKKTVAVLDPICRDNSVNGFFQQMVRGAMESAVTASSEYEAYDRSAFDQIQKEQAFQRTGNVSDSQIKKMGEMAGVDYVLVSEVSAYEGYLSAIVKILNIETGKYDKSIDDYMQLSPDAVKTKCREMATSLFGKVYSASTMSTNNTYKSSSSTNTQTSTYNQSTPSYSNHSLSVDKTYFSVSCDYNVVYLTVTCDTTWEVQHPTASMYTVDRNGNTLKITIKENPFQYDRSNYFNVAISDGSVVKKISLIQKGNPNGAGSQAYSEDPNSVFTVVEDMPEFPGGQRALFKYLSEHIKYPVIAQENGIQGRVICQFTIDKGGSIVDVEVVRSAGDPSLDREAVRVIKSMPKWKPGQQRGLLVRTRYTLPCNFSLK